MSACGGFLLRAVTLLFASPQNVEDFLPGRRREEKSKGLSPWPQAQSREVPPLPSRKWWLRGHKQNGESVLCVEKPWKIFGMGEQCGKQLELYSEH